jgi:hypothetical protein
MLLGNTSRPVNAGVRWRLGDRGDVLVHTDRLDELKRTRLDYWRELVNYMERRDSPVR